MDLLTCFKALGDSSRLNLINILLKSDLCVGALARMLKLSEPALSQHLKLLREAGLVRGEKRGYWTHYAVDREALRQMAKALSEMTEPLQPFETACWKSARPLNASLRRRAKDTCSACCRTSEKKKGRQK